MTIVDLIKNRSRLASDGSLTKKASLNAFSVVLDYGARLLVGFLTTPILLAGLGPYFFGAWQILNRLIGYISPSSGRPTQALKWTIARGQASTDYDQKRQHVGSAFIVWLLFMPLMMLLGAVLIWLVPHWLKTPADQFWQVRLCTGVLVANLALTSVATIPMSVLQGENLGYKRMGLSALTVLLGGGLVWLAIHLKMGLPGVAGAALAATLMNGALFLKVARTHAKWFKVSIPPFSQTRQFLGLSLWFLGWNLVMNLMTASDIVLLGFIKSAEAVTDYSLLKYAPETLISIIAMMNFGITPGLGGIIGSGRLKKAAEIRGEMMSLTWLITTALGAAILTWNRSFLNLWVGPGHYIGDVSAILVTMVVTQFVLIRCDAGVIDISLDLRRKVLMGFASAAAAILIAGLLVGVFKLGVPGLCLGIMAGRFVLSIEYPSIVGRFLGVSLISQLRSCLRPAAVTMSLYALATWLGHAVILSKKSGLLGWAKLGTGALLTCAGFLAAAFFLGLSGPQRETISRRWRAANASGAGEPTLEGLGVNGIKD